MRMLTHLCLILAFGSLAHGRTVEIRGIAVEEKANGTIIRIQRTGTIERSQIAAWTSDTGWLYVTLMGGTIDTTRLWPFVPTGIVTEFQAHQLPEAVQLNFRLAREIASFEIDGLPAEDDILIALRLPVTDTLGDLVRLGNMGGEEIRIDASKPAGTGWTPELRLPYALMALGTGLVATGLVRSDGLNFILGAVILVGGQVLGKKKARTTGTE